MKGLEKLSFSFSCISSKKWDDECVERISSELVFCGKCESIYVLFPCGEERQIPFGAAVFTILSVPIHKSWKWIRRKFEELKLSYDKADGVSYHHQKGTDMAIRSGEKGTKFALTFFPSLNWKCFFHTLNKVAKYFRWPQQH